MTAAFVTYEDLAKMEKKILGQAAPAAIQDEHDRNTKFRRTLSADLAIGRLLTGTTFIDTVSIDNGAITAEKLTASLVLSTEIIAGAASPSDRLTLDATGIKAYGTVSGTPNTNTLSIGTNGNFTFGTGANAITYVASTGTLTVPAATIGGLTIADVGTGNLGGTYSTSSSGARIVLAPSSLRAYNAAGNRTLDINAVSGEVEISSDPVATSRLDLSADGIELWKSSTRQFYLAVGVTNAVTMLLTGPGVGEYIGMNPTDGLWLGASTFAGAATKFRVSPLGALEATSATISGAITATSGSLSNLSVSGTLTMGASGLIRTSSTTTRLEIDNTGIFGYNAGTARFQVLNNGSGFLGASSTFSWTSAGAVTIGGFTVGSSSISGGVLTLNSNGSISTGNFAVSTSGVMSATSATLSGSITATSLTITGTANFSGGSLTLPGGGQITSSTLDINSGTLAGLTVDGDVTVGSGGKIRFGSGGTDYLDNNLLHFEVSSSEAAAIEAKNSSNNYYSQLRSSAGSSATSMSIWGTNSASGSMYSQLTLSLNSSSSTLSYLAGHGGFEASIQVQASGAGTSEIQLNASSITVNGTLILGNSGGAAGAFYGRVAVTVPGVGTKYLHLFS